MVDLTSGHIVYAGFIPRIRFAELEDEFLRRKEPLYLTGCPQLALRVVASSQGLKLYLPSKEKLAEKKCWGYPKLILWLRDKRKFRQRGGSRYR